MAHVSPISATDLFNYEQCPHRFFCDTHEKSAPDDSDTFIEMLWDQGVAHEKSIINDMKGIHDLSDLPADECEAETIRAMKAQVPLIYQGRFTSGERVGIPDLLVLQPCGKYAAADIKAGNGYDSEETSTLVPAFAIILCHYERLLQELGFSTGQNIGYILDGKGRWIKYCFEENISVRNKNTWLQKYQTTFDEVLSIRDKKKVTLPALSASCKLCCWRTVCKQAVLKKDDLTKIAELGRSRRDCLVKVFPTVKSLARAQIEKFIFEEKKKEKTEFAGIGAETLRKFHARAVLLNDPNGVSYKKKEIILPQAEKVVFFDIEADPTRDGFVYLHGWLEEKVAKGEMSFQPVICTDITLAEEERAFAESWKYLTDRSKDSVVYYYSRYERTAYRKLANKYPSVCHEDDITDLFLLPNIIDLYSDIIKPSTEWKAFDQSIKTLAVLLGFKWRDINPSGAASITWFNNWVDTKENTILKRILDYNEDDCMATKVVLEGVKRLPFRSDRQQGKTETAQSKNLSFPFYAESSFNYA